MPPWIAGWSVFTRPSSISGNPVTSATSRTARPAAASARAVPPVDRSSTPSSARPRARSTSPVLSETERSARRTRAHDSPGPHRARGGPDAATSSAALGVEADRLRVEPMLLGEDPRGQRRLRVVIEHGNRRLQHDRPRVHALVDEVDGRPRHLDAVLERLALGVEPGKRRQQRRMDVQDPAPVAPDELRPRAPACSRPGTPARPRPRRGSPRSRRRRPSGPGRRADRGAPPGCPPGARARAPARPSGRSRRRPRAPGSVRRRSRRGWPGGSTRGPRREHRGRGGQIASRAHSTAGGVARTVGRSGLWPGRREDARRDAPHRYVTPRAPRRISPIRNAGATGPPEPGEHARRVTRRHHEDEADPHVEDPEHLRLVDAAAGPGATGRPRTPARCRGRITARQPGGRTRGRLPVSPPPVM